MSAPSPSATVHLADSSQASLALQQPVSHDATNSGQSSVQTSFIDGRESTANGQAADEAEDDLHNSLEAPLTLPQRSLQSPQAAFSSLQPHIEASGTDPKPQLDQAVSSSAKAKAGVTPSQALRRLSLHKHPVPPPGIMHECSLVVLPYASNTPVTVLLRTVMIPGVHVTATKLVRPCIPVQMLLNTTTRDQWCQVLLSRACLES